MESLARETTLEPTQADDTTTCARSGSSGRSVPWQRVQATDVEAPTAGSAVPGDAKGVPDPTTGVVGLMPVPLEVPFALPRVDRPPASRFELLQQFEGTVLSVDDEGFRARLVDRTTPSHAPEIATFDLSDVSDDDRALLEPGAVFYWSLGYRVHPWGQRERASPLTFRRLPAWSRADLAAAEGLSAQWASLLSGDGPR